MAINWSPLYNQYRGQWVALENDEVTVISSGATAKDAFQLAQKKGFSKPILTRVPENLATYIG